MMTDTFFLSVMASIVSKQQQCLKQEHELLLPKRSRKSFYIRNRLEWDRHVQELAEEGPHAFPRLYRMQESSFVKLSQLIEPFVCVDGEM
jgi:hypothetical protein